MNCNAIMAFTMVSSRTTCPRIRFVGPNEVGTKLVFVDQTGAGFVSLFLWI